jgi:excisionase family DNA binding protein
MSTEIQAEDLVFTEAEAAAKLKVAEVTLRKWRYKGRARHSRIGRLVRYTREDLDATLALNRREAKAA